MNEFDKGWWNCFLTFAAEFLDVCEYGSEDLLFRVLEGAAVSEAEIEFVLNSNFTHNNHVRDLLNCYLKNKLSL